MTWGYSVSHLFNCHSGVAENPPYTSKFGKSLKNHDSLTPCRPLRKVSPKIILQICIACVDKEVSDHDRVTEYKIKMFTMTNFMFLNHCLFVPDGCL